MTDTGVRGYALIPAAPPGLPAPAQSAEEHCVRWVLKQCPLFHPCPARTKKHTQGKHCRDLSTLRSSLVYCSRAGFGAAPLREVTVAFLSVLGVTALRAWDKDRTERALELFAGICKQHMQNARGYLVRRLHTICHIGNSVFAAHAEAT